MGTLAKWLQGRKGFVSPKLDLCKDLGGDRGVVAVEALEEDETLVVVPTSCCLVVPSKEELDKSPDAFPAAAKYLAERKSEGLTPFLAACLLAMSEAAKGGDGQWAPYFGALPESVDTCLMYWNAEDKEHLKGTSIYDPEAEPLPTVWERHVAPVAAERPDLWPKDKCTLQQFTRLAGLVQSRAFHMVAENWVTGASSQDVEQLYVLPAIDMVNHSTDPGRRNAVLARLHAPAGGRLDLGAGRSLELAEPYFVMKAGKAVAAGEQVLHTYGDLGDAQLLQVYGFIDLPELQQQAAEEEEAAAGAGGSKDRPGKKKKKSGGEPGPGVRLPRNPNNFALLPWKLVRNVAKGVLEDAVGKKERAAVEALLEQKAGLLARWGLLQPAAPGATEFVVSVVDPLPDELLTAVQVALMSEEELNALKEEHEGPDAPDAPGGEGGSKKRPKQTARKPLPPIASGAAAPGGSAAEPVAAAAAVAVGPGGSIRPPPSEGRLSLGTGLLDEDPEFAEMVAFVLAKAFKERLESYPTSRKEDLQLLAKGGVSERRRLAALVQLGEKDALGLAEKGAVMILMNAAAGASRSKRKKQRKEEGKEEGGGEGEKEEEDDDDSDDEDVELGSEDDSDDGSDGEDESGDGGEGDMLASEDSEDKVGFGDVDYDDGPGEAHDRMKPHDAPQGDE